MREVVIISGKGGTGKTSLTASFALLGGEDMVVADCDVDAADMHLLLEPRSIQTDDFYSGKMAEIDPDSCTNCGLCREKCRFNAIRIAGGQHPWFGDLGLQLTRNFRALKVWMTLKAYGLDKFTRLVEQNVAQARYLADLVETRPQLELLADVPLNIVCFRFVSPDKSDEELDDINLEVMLRLHERGLAVPSYTRLNGKFALRVAITNHRSRREDFDFLVTKVIEIAQEVIAS